MSNVTRYGLYRWTLSAACQYLSRQRCCELHYRLPDIVGGRPGICGLPCPTVARISEPVCEALSYRSSGRHLPLIVTLLGLFELPGLFSVELDSTASNDGVCHVDIILSMDVFASMVWQSIRSTLGHFVVLLFP